MSSRALVFPGGTVKHLGVTERGSHPELAALARLEDAGLALGVVVLPAAIEDSFYRLNNLPARLARLYRGLDPRDPDEDILEDAADAAQDLLAGSYLLDDLIDAVYASLAWLPERVMVRRAGSTGSVVTGGREALLAVKRLFRDDWTVARVLERLGRDARLGVEGRPVLVHDARSSPVGPGGDDRTSRTASAALGHDVTLSVDPTGAVTGVAEPAPSVRATS